MQEIPEPPCKIYRIKSDVYPAIYRVVGYVDFFFNQDGFDGIEFKVSKQEMALAVELVNKLPEPYRR